MEQALLEQETRRQAMLQVMGLEVWLPRQQLPHAAPSADWLLNWQPQISQPISKPTAPVAPAAQQRPATQPTAQQQPPSTNGLSHLQQVRQSLQQTTQPPPAPQQQPATKAPTPETTSTSTSKVPRFSLQLMRSGSCLLLVDLPMGESFQARDPEYILLKDLLRAAGLGDKPSMLRGAEPIRWPLLHSGALAQDQSAEQASDFVREILLLESSQQPTTIVWLLGENAVSFANRPQEQAEDFSLSPLAAQVQCWNLPGLERLMQQQQLKPLLWQSMQKLMPRWLERA